MQKLLKVVLLFMAMVFIISQALAGSVNANIQIYSGDPTIPTLEAQCMEPLFVGLAGLKPFERYNIQILSSNGALIAQYTFNASAKGDFPPAVMWPEAGLPPVGRDGGPANPMTDLQLGTNMVVLTGGDIKATTQFSIVPKKGPTVWASKRDGRVSNGFLLKMENIFATGAGFTASKYVSIYIMPDKDIWTKGDILKDPKLYFKNVIATVDSTGKLGPVDLGLAELDALHGNYANFDIVVDANLNGILDDGDAVDRQYGSGYTVQSPMSASLLRMQLASNGLPIDATRHWDATFNYPDIFNHDGSNTRWNSGVFCILNPLIDSTDPKTHLVENSYVQIWVITLSDFNNLPLNRYSLLAKDVSDYQGRPDLITVHRTCGNGAYSFIVWNAPLEDRRGKPYENGTGYVVIVERPDAYGVFDNLFNPNTDFVDGVLNSGPIPVNEGFVVLYP